MDRYILTSRQTELKAWPHQIMITWGTEPRFSLVWEINDWCIENRVKIEHYGGFLWYLKDESDVIAFKLRWG